VAKFSSFHPVLSVVKNSGTIAVPGGRVPDASRTGIGRVRPSRSLGKMRRRTGGRVQGVKYIHPHCSFFTLLSALPQPQVTPPPPRPPRSRAFLTDAANAMTDRLTDATSKSTRFYRGPNGLTVNLEYVYPHPVPRCHGQNPVCTFRGEHR
jgi:hypothetical protein